MAATTTTNSSSSSQAHISKHLFMAATSSGIAEIVTFPIDTIKVYLQLQTKFDGKNPHLPSELEVGSAHSGMKSGHTHHNQRLGINNLYNVMHEIYFYHGIKGYYRGYKPAVIRAGLNNALSATIYKPVRHYLGSENRDCPLYIKLLSGILTGASTQILASPTDLLKVRMQADAIRHNPRYCGFFDAINQIYHKYGWKAFYKGIGPSMLRAGFSVAATLGTYDHSKSLILKSQWSLNNSIKETDIKLHIICSLCSGFLATLLAVPFDVIKTKYQSQSFNSPTYVSARHCLSTILEKEGISALFKGWIPMYARLGPWQITFFVVFELLHKEILGQSF